MARPVSPNATTQFPQATAQSPRPTTLSLNVTSPQDVTGAQRIQPPLAHSPVHEPLSPFMALLQTPAPAATKPLPPLAPDQRRQKHLQDFLDYVRKQAATFDMEHPAVNGQRSATNVLFGDDMTLSMEGVVNDLMAIEDNRLLDQAPDAYAPGNPTPGEEEVKDYTPGDGAYPPGNVDLSQYYSEEDVKLDDEVPGVLPPSGYVTLNESLKNPVSAKRSRPVDGTEGDVENPGVTKKSRSTGSKRRGRPPASQEEKRAKECDKAARKSAVDQWVKAIQDGGDLPAKPTFRYNTPVNMAHWVNNVLKGTLSKALPWAALEAMGAECDFAVLGKAGGIKKMTSRPFLEILTRVAKKLKVLIAANQVEEAMKLARLFPKAVMGEWEFTSVNKIGVAKSDGSVRAAILAVEGHPCKQLLELL